ncbi:MAG: penicillin-binding protein [Lachnospiraceae bacterium]|nr:penicillin-binding protein [Lachnospiraceae bacterium]
MLRELLEIFKEFFDRLFHSRLFPVAAIFTIMFAVLIVRLFQLQILEVDDHQEDYIQMSLTTVSTDSVRGNIYDRNGVLLAYDQLVYSVTLKDIGYYEKSADKNAMILELIHLLDECDEDIIMTIPVVVSDDNDSKYEYSTTETTRIKQFLRDIYGIKLSQLDDATGKYPSDISADEAIEIMKKNYYFSKWLGEDGKPVELTPADELRVCNIRYMLAQYMYRKYISITIASDVKPTTMSTVLEYASNLRGVDVEEDYIRVYPDGEYFSQIIGYTGLASAEELAALQKEDETYSANDYIGKSGIEALLEQELSGTKGSKTMYLDSTGKVLEVISEDKAVVGNDVYLTIDHDMTIACYKLLEQQLANTILKYLVNGDVDNTNSDTIYISIKDVYYHLFYNNVLSYKDMGDADAPQWEKDIYQVVDTYKQNYVTLMRGELYSDNPTSMSGMNSVMNQAFTYAFNWLINSKYILSENLDNNADYYTAMTNGTGNMRDFIYSLISEANIINVSTLITDDDYYDGDIIYDLLINIMFEKLYDDEEFNNIFIKDLINYYAVEPYKVCLSLYSQGVLKEDQAKMAELLKGDYDYSYEFMYNCIKNIEITPAQLALDPCNGSVIITDVHNGDVLALVSYPSYDNNMFSGTVDATYYSKLLNDKSYPLINYATQARNAPGSTFKIVSAIAGLEEGIVDTERLIDCLGIFELVTPAAKCSIYNSTGAGHGPLNIVQAIAESCNYYFYTIGYEMSINDEGEYEPELGIEKLQYYASLLGLDEKSGIEMSEYAPQISTEFPVPSAIGQGTNNYAPVQLSRYVTAVANSGNLFNLTLLDKVTDYSGKVVKEYENTAEQIKGISDETWDIVQKGMYEVTHSGSVSTKFKYTGLDVAAKTGTAQEDLTRSNHAVFISYAPTTEPEISLTCTMRFGYSSGYTAELAANIYKYYFGKITLEDILGNSVLDSYVSGE